MLKNFWYACEFSHAVINQPKQIELWKQKIVLYRDASGKIVALKDICPHRGTALSSGKVEQDCLRCPYHGWKFGSDGICIEIPANQPSISIPKKARVNSYPVQEKYGFVWLFWGDLSLDESPPVPSLPEFSDSSWRSLYLELEFNAHYTRLLENFTDPVHPIFVHANSFGNGIAKEPHFLAKGKVFLSEWGGNTVLIVEQPTPKSGLYWKYTYSKQQQEVKTELGFRMPNVTLLSLNFKYAINQYFCLVPIDENRTLVKIIQFRNFLTYFWADILFRHLILQGLQEDRLVVEKQLPQAVPDDLTAELNVAGDALSVAYRKLRKKCLELGWGVESDNSNQNK
jgi:phenylpropionate dioxygenase-like ring-hydroxylating dioxygenase large terminal subunit